MARPPRSLTLQTRSVQAQFGGQPLPLNRHWLYLYGLLALRQLEGGEMWVTVEDINRLPTWTGVQAKSVATSLFRHVSQMRAAGYGLLVSPPGEGTKRVALDREVVGELRVDVELCELRAWLGLDELAGPPPARSLDAARLLALAESAFEQGRSDDAEALCAQALKAAPSADQRLRALALTAWVRTVGGTHEQGWAAVQAMQRQLGEELRSSMSAPSRAVQALVHIQTARFFLRKHEARPARAAYLRATALLAEGDHREWGAVEAGLGYLAQRAGQLPEAQRRYLAALTHFSEGRWAWAMHAQYNNLAAVSFQLHARAQSRQPRMAAHWLDEAIRWSREALEFAEQMDFGGSVDLEVNLAYAYRLKGELVEAASWTRRAVNIARASGNLSDLAVALAERAEVEEAQGDRAAALLTMREALSRLREVGSDAWTSAAEARLAELEGRAPLTVPLKLW